MKIHNTGMNEWGFEENLFSFFQENEIIFFIFQDEAKYLPE